MYHDTHTHHSPLSKDARQSLEQLVETAQKAGLDGILLTDHLDIDFPEIGMMTETFEIDAGYDEWKRFTSQRDRPILPSIGFGVEIGYQPHLAPLCRSMVESGRFDGIVLSMHLLDRQDPFFSPSLYDEGPVKTYSAYLDACTDMMEQVPGTAIIGHYDYIARYAPYEEPAMRYEAMPKAFDRFFETIIGTGKCLEFNIRSRRRRIRSDPMKYFVTPDPAIFARYVELGGTRVSLGSDAHSPGESGQWFAEAAAFLYTCGVRQLTHLERGAYVMSDITPPNAMMSPS